MFRGVAYEPRRIEIFEMIKWQLGHQDHTLALATVYEAILIAGTKFCPPSFWGYLDSLSLLQRVETCHPRII